MPDHQLHHVCVVVMIGMGSERVCLVERERERQSESIPTSQYLRLH